MSNEFSGNLSDRTYAEAFPGYLQDDDPVYERVDPDEYRDRIKLERP